MKRRDFFKFLGMAASAPLASGAPVATMPEPAKVRMDLTLKWATLPANVQREFTAALGARP